MVTFSTIFVDGPLKYLEGFLGTIHGYVSLREVSAFISADVADDI